MPNISAAIDLVHRDVHLGLSGAVAPERDENAFAIADGFEFVGDAPVTDREERVAVVPWQWRGVHVDELLGIAPTDRALVVRGVTLVTGDEGNELLHRYVDWADVLQQLDARFYGRPVVDALERWGDELREVEQFARLREGEESV